MISPPYYCYIVYDNNDCVYNGFSNNIERRIRQHNCIIKGGAKYTTRRSLNSSDDHWKYLVIITSEQFTYKKALSVEWSIKYPNNKRPRPAIYNSPSGRIKSLPLVFQNPKFADLVFTVKVCAPEYLELITEVLSCITNVTII